MPRYRATSDLFVDNRFINSDTEFTSDATPGYHWSPLDEEAKARMAAGNEEPKTLSEDDGDKIYVDAEPEEIDGKLYASVDGLTFEVTDRNVREDLSLTAGGIEKYEAAKKA